MSRVKSQDTKPERLIRSIIHRMGYRFSLHRKDLPGHPDIVLNRLQKVILVNGCFWHGHSRCSRATLPSTNREFWENKIANNKLRDEKVRKKLRSTGWQLLVVWQCQTKDTARLADRVSRFLSQ